MPPEVAPDDSELVDSARAELIARYDVPRETTGRLDLYAAMLAEWQQRLNLVGPATLSQLWHRHFLDSAQLLDHVAGQGLSWIDIGSGAGFPGLIVAMLRPDIRVTLVESREKKCVFLRAVAEACQIEQRVTVLSVRTEMLPIARFDVISARALASLTQLFDWGLRFAESDTQWVLPKGASVIEELSDAGKKFSFSHALRPSITDDAARIVLAHGVKRRKRT